MGDEDYGSGVERPIKRRRLKPARLCTTGAQDGHGSLASLAIGLGNQPRGEPALGEQLLEGRGVHVADDLAEPRLHLRQIPGLGDQRIDRREQRVHLRLPVGQELVDRGVDRVTIRTGLRIEGWLVGPIAP